MANRVYHSNKISDENKALMLEYIKNHPLSSYSHFKNALGDKVTCSDAHYYTIKRSVYGRSRAAPAPSKASKAASKTTKRAYHRKDTQESGTVVRKIAATLYMTLWSYPTEKVSDDTRKALKDFLDTLNSVRKSRFSMVEMKDPAVIEIRETHVRS